MCMEPYFREATLKAEVVTMVTIAGSYRVFCFGLVMLAMSVRRCFINFASQSPGKYVVAGNSTTY